MRIYNILARLIDYPDEALYENLDNVRQLLLLEPGLAAREREMLESVLDWMQARPLLELQEIYVQTFDMVPEHSLHLTHHSYGDSRERGPALVELTELYKGDGLTAVEGELPDYLPLILEYVSILDELQARVFLGETANVLAVVAANLERAASPYAALIRLIEGRGRLARSAA